MIFLFIFVPSNVHAPTPRIWSQCLSTDKKKKKKQAWSQAISVLQNVPHVYSSDPNTQHPVILALINLIYTTIR